MVSEVYPGIRMRKTKRVWREILRRLSIGEMLKDICESSGMPTRQAIFQWMDADKSGEAWKQYDEALVKQAETWADDIVVIADGDLAGDDTNERIRRDDLRVKTRQWAMARRSKRFADRAALQVEGSVAHKLEVSWLAPQLAPGKAEPRLVGPDCQTQQLPSPQPEYALGGVMSNVQPDCPSQEARPNPAPKSMLPPAPPPKEPATPPRDEGTSQSHV